MNVPTGFDFHGLLVSPNMQGIVVSTFLFLSFLCSFFSFILLISLIMVVGTERLALIKKKI